MHRRSAVPTRLLALGLAPALLSLMSCVESARTAEADAESTEVSSDNRPIYGPASPLGNGQVRTYLLRDPATGDPVEIGVALTETALDGLPDLGSGHVSMEEMDESMFHTYDLELPPSHGTPFRFVELNWNPFGHEPEGVYLNVPHFDFHFYTIPIEARNAIMPNDPEWAAKADRLPTGVHLPAHNVVLAPPDMTPAQVAVPMMGVHWVDARSPELQAMFGNPDGYEPFTATFIHGSWDGKLTFWEPMITRAYIQSKKDATDPAVRDEVRPIPTPQTYPGPGHYPDGYRIAWDPETREYRIALTGLAARN